MSSYFSQRFNALVDGGTFPEEVIYDDQSYKWVQEYRYREMVLEKFGDKPEVLRVAFDYPETVVSDVHVSFCNHRNRLIFHLFPKSRNPTEYWRAWFDLTEPELQRVVPTIVGYMSIKRDPIADRNFIEEAYKDYLAQFENDSLGGVDRDFLEKKIAQWNKIVNPPK